MRMEIKKLIKSFLPGLFLLGFNIGTGSVTTMAKAGAVYGMSLLWAIILSCIVTYFLIIIFSRYTMVTGQTALHAFRTNIHPFFGIFFIVALTAGTSASIMGVMGIICDVCHVWSMGFIAGGISPVLFAFFFILLVIYIFWNGKTDFFQRALAVMVAIMAGCFVLNFFIMMPPFSQILQGAIPSLPHAPSDQGDGPFLVIASMVGTTVSGCLFIIRTTLVKEAGWTLNDLKTEKRDALFSVFMMFVLSATIMAAAAGTLHVKGLTLSKSSELVTLLEPLAGGFAVAVLVIGIIAAGLSSQFPNALLLPWLLCDYNNSPRTMTMGKYRAMFVALSLLGLVVPVFGFRPIPVMILSQALGTIQFPLLIVCIAIIGNKRPVMGEHSFGAGTHSILFVIMAFACYMSYTGIKGLINVFF